MQTADLLSELLMLRTSPPVQLQIDGLCGSRAWAGRTDLKSVERPFLLIWLNHWRQMQPIQNSGNLWILRWALTYITMTSKHNFRGHLPSLPSASSLPIPPLSQAHPLLLLLLMPWIPPTPPSHPCSMEKTRLC